MNETMVNLSTLTDEDESHSLINSATAVAVAASAPLHQKMQPMLIHPCNSLNNTSDIPMREMDADILELGVEERRREDLSDFDENGRRAVRADSFCSLEGAAPAVDEEGGGEKVVAALDAGGEEGEISGSSTTAATASMKHIGSMPQIAEDSEQDDYFVGTDVPSAATPTNDGEGDVLKHQRGKHARCNSFERRSRESAQFALVVGENSNLLLNKIIEEDSSSDFDDDDIDELEEEEEVKETTTTESDFVRDTAPSPIHSSNSASAAATAPMMVDHVQSLRMSSLAIHPPFVDWKFTRQYSSGIEQETTAELGYRGIRTSLLEITQRGVSRGNYAQLHRKAWLEVSDLHHRYGKNLRLYYKHWESLGHPYSMFFDWLDSKGEAAGEPLPNLAECPRSVLDSDTVLYVLDPKVSDTYSLEIVADQRGNAIVLDRSSKRPVCTGKEGWIFVLRDHVMYGSQKVTAPTGVAEGAPAVRQRFHHSSFFGGKAVASAGIFLTDDQGRLTDLWPHSGHYRPGEAHMQRALFFMQQKGVDLTTFEVDMQQIFKVCRKKSPKDKAKKKDTPTSDTEEHQNPQEAQLKKAKKTECLLNMGGFEVACFLAHKARMIEKGVFHQIHKIRKLPHEQRGCVSAALRHVHTDDV